ncbi:hypothetical protein OCAR_6961 [Afipia carboxidovorans OM5]|nr:hypothetical protein OCAR_6961 [Afipia carboxidovorans OM5]
MEIHAHRLREKGLKGQGARAARPTCTMARLQAIRKDSHRRQNGSESMAVSWPLPAGTQKPA